jgi:hypothetical protein
MDIHVARPCLSKLVFFLYSLLLMFVSVCYLKPRKLVSRLDLGGGGWSLDLFYCFDPPCSTLSELVEPEIKDMAGDCRN